MMFANLTQSTSCKYNKIKIPAELAHSHSLENLSNIIGFQPVFISVLINCLRTIVIIIFKKMTII